MSHKTNLHFTTVVFFSLFCWFFKRKVNLLGKGRKKFNPQLPQAYHPLFATVCNHDLSYNRFCRYLTILKSVFMAMYIMWFRACERTFMRLFRSFLLTSWIWSSLIHKQYNLKTQESGIAKRFTYKNPWTRKTQSQHLSQLYLNFTTFPVLQTSWNTLWKIIKFLFCLLINTLLPLVLNTF